MQTTLRRTVSAVALAVTLGACSTAGTPTVNDFGRFQQTQPGATTKPQVHSLFGQPHDVRQVDGGSMWTYYEISRRMDAAAWIPVVGMLVGGEVFNATQADFFFDGEGVLLRSQREQHQRRINQWATLETDLTPSGHAAAVEQEMARLGLPFDQREARRMGALADHLD